MEKMYTYEFYDKCSGEYFFVETTYEEEAMNTAVFYFGDPVMTGVYDNDDETDMFIVECAGYDTY